MQIQNAPSNRTLATKYDDLLVCRMAMLGLDLA